MSQPTDRPARFKWLRRLLGCRHEYVRDTVDGVKVFKCACGHTVPQLKRDEPFKDKPKPAHERMKALRAEMKRFPQRRAQ